MLSMVKIFQLSLDICANINRMIGQYVEAGSKRGKAKAKKMHKTSWNHPPLGFRKFNFDVAVEEDSGFLAVVARDHEGNVKAI